MTKHIHNPFRSEEGAEVYDLSAGMFFCLVQLYRDFSRRHPGFELSQYYEIYLQTSKNKCVLDATLLPKVGFESFFQAQRYYYDIKTQAQIDESKHEAWHAPLDQLNVHDGFNELLAPASLLYKIYMTYRQFVLKNVTGLPLAWHSFELALLGDEPLMSLAIYPAIEPGQWMEGVLGGLEGYMTFDLKRDLVLESNIRVWGMWIGRKK